MTRRRSLCAGYQHVDCERPLLGVIVINERGQPICVRCRKRADEPQPGGAPPAKCIDCGAFTTIRVDEQPVCTFHVTERERVAAARARRGVA